MKVSEETKDSVQEIAEQFGKSKKEGKEDFMELDLIIFKTSTSYTTLRRHDNFER